MASRYVVKGSSAHVLIPAAPLGMTIHDISRTLSPTTATWPGDAPVEWSWTAQMSEGASVNLGAIATSVHAATHADAPLHYQPDGASIGEIPLRHFVGPVQVTDVGDAPAITTRHVQDLDAPRILFRTPHSEVSGDEWSEAFPPIDAAAIDALGERGVVLIGTDAPSVDPVDSKDLPAHHALARAGIVNLENLCLSGVAPGTYTLVALPLKIDGGDAAPVRAVLLDAPASDLPASNAPALDML